MANYGPPSTSDALAGLPGVGDPTPPATGGGTKSPLGVPKGYKPGTQVDPYAIARAAGSKGYAPTTVPNVTQFLTQPRGKPYIAGDQFAPVGDPASIPGIQKGMVEAGLLNAKDVRVGVWDTRSADAYVKVLSFANAYGMTANDALSTLVSTAPPAATSQRQAPTMSLTSPESARAAFKAAAEQIVGYDLPKAQEDAFVATLHQQELNAYNQLAKVQASPSGGGTYTGAPTAAEAAQSYIQGTDPALSEAYGSVQRMNEFYAMLGNAAQPAPVQSHA